MARVLDDDLYDRLGVGPTASSDEIATAFRTRAKELHPDVHPGDAAADERFKRLTHAYDVLIRPEARAAYDRRRATPPRPPAQPTRAPAAAPAATPLRDQAIFTTPRSARTAIWAGIVLTLVGIACAVTLTLVSTGDAAKTITLWIVVAKLVICGPILAGFGAWRLSRLRETGGFATRR